MIKYTGNNFAIFSSENNDLKTYFIHLHVSAKFGTNFLIS